MTTAQKSTTRTWTCMAEARVHFMDRGYSTWADDGPDRYVLQHDATRHYVVLEHTGLLQITATPFLRIYNQERDRLERVRFQIEDGVLSVFDEVAGQFTTNHDLGEEEIRQAHEMLNDDF